MSSVARPVILALVAVLAGCAQGPTHSPVGGIERRSESAPSADPARDAVVYAMSLIGAPYRNGGTTPQSGFDCSGFVWYVYRQSAGIALPRSADEMGRSGQPVAANELRPGDLVFYNTLGRDFSHVGIYIGEDRFVHAPSNGGTVGIVSMRSAYWLQRYAGARRVAF